MIGLHHLVYVVMGVEPRALDMLGKHSTSQWSYITIPWAVLFKSLKLGCSLTKLVQKYQMEKTVKVNNSYLFGLCIKLVKA